MKSNPTIFVLFGASGDLAKRYVLNAINALGTKGKLPEYFKIIGTTRRPDLKKEDLLKEIQGRGYLEDNFEILQVEENKNSFINLKKVVSELSKNNKRAQILFYLSVPPQASKKIVKLISENFKENKKQIKLLLEKPFGTDYKSAEKLISSIDQYFSPLQTYRIDHYLFKQIVGEILDFKQKNKYIWSKKLLTKINIEAVEKMGIEHRTNFYDKTGALRDMVQSHLLEVLAVILSSSTSVKDKKFPNNRLSVLNKIKLADTKPVMGQYDGYKNETGNKESKTETFVSINLQSKGMPNTSISISTGKNLDRKESFVKINWNKKGKEYFKVFSEKDRQYNSYEDVILDAVNSRKELFVSEKEILINWLIVSKVKKNNLVIYPKGAKVEEVIKL